MSTITTLNDRFSKVIGSNKSSETPEEKEARRAEAKAREVAARAKQKELQREDAIREKKRAEARRRAKSVAYGIPIEDVDHYSRINESPVYKRLQEILYAYIIFVLGNALILAADVAFGVEIIKAQAIANTLDFVAMAFGLIMTAMFIHAVYKGLKFGVFEGFQKKLAQIFLLIAFADESASLVAKFNASSEQLLELYTGVILPLTAPAICLFAMILILSEQIARRYRKTKESNVMFDHEKTMSIIQRKTEAIRAERRERRTREKAVRMYAIKQRVHAYWFSIFYGKARRAAAKQSRSLIDDIVKSNAFAVKEPSGDGHASSIEIPELTINDSGGASSKKAGRIFGIFRRK